MDCMDCKHYYIDDDGCDCCECDYGIKITLDIPEECTEFEEA